MASRPVRWCGSSLRGLALASVIANIGIIVTGAAVRLTKSGLGCPTWPRCTDDSYVTTPEMGINGVIEFGNRLLTFVLIAIAVACFLGALARRRRSLVKLSVAVALGIPGQGVIGGITVLTNLNPWVVGLHFILSIALIAGAFALWRRVGEGDGDPVLLVPAPLRQLAWLTTAASLAVIAAGVVVTGSGPHSGDQGAKRNNLDPQQISQIHADLVFLLIGLTVALWFALRAADAPAEAVRAVAVLFWVEMGQGLIGFVQYFTHLPVALVAAHMLGSGLVWFATLAVLWSLRSRPAVQAAPPQPAPEPATTGEPVPAA
ncbi:COX15/CtaA family protein [Actinoplanes sp. CA-252034]|uniref:COX15/CtaA family protein n=1 Tax=Actinoplanes sp. CA-252034 TaxID=3239906 RepID=UPI003D99888A